MSDDNKKVAPVSTVQIATDYVDTPAATISSWKTKDLGLQFLLFGIAELNAKRAIRLMGYVSDLEDTVFDPDTLRELQPKEVLGAYKLSTETLRDTLDYISKTRKEMDWTAINEQLAELSANKNDTEGEIDIRKNANKLIEAMKNMNTPKKESTDE